MQVGFLKTMKNLFGFDRLDELDITSYSAGTNEDHHRNGEQQDQDEEEDDDDCEEEDDDDGEGKGDERGK